MDPIKLTAICDWKPPTSVKGIQSFLGFANFYRKFIPNFSHVVAPLNLLTRKDQLWSWTPLQQKAFDTLRTAFSSRPVLGIPDVAWPFSIMTDASLFAAGVVLLQDDTNGDAHTCSYFSKTFIPAERNYDIYDCQRRDFPPTTTQPNVGSRKEIPEGGKGESKRRSCRLPELQERGFVTAGLRLQLVCCT